MSEISPIIEPTQIRPSSDRPHEIDFFNAVGPGTPRVAILSAVETVTTKIPSTIDAAALCKMADRGQITGGVLDGPLAFDNAVDPEAVRIKGIRSEVAGRAQILVVPDLEAGNMLAKNVCQSRCRWNRTGRGCRRARIRCGRAWHPAQSRFSTPMLAAALPRFRLRERHGYYTGR